MTRSLPTLAAALFALTAVTAGCGSEDHAHGPDTHTHEDAPAAAAPSTTYLDTTGTAPDTTGFFEQAQAAADSAATHTHDDGTTHDH